MIFCLYIKMVNKYSQKKKKKNKQIKASKRSA